VGRSRGRIGWGDLVGQQGWGCGHWVPLSVEGVGGEAGGLGVACVVGLRQFVGVGG